MAAMFPIRTVSDMVCPWRLSGKPASVRIVSRLF